ncbi:MAG: histidinol dehydrogenase, partial [Rhizobiales bacterium]|nr:histidinol dehydrogenase [Hyphomicrobiales bacterium]
MLRLDTRSADFSESFRRFLSTKREASVDVAQAVARIVDDVRARGDRALVELTKKFDRLDLGTVGLRVTTDELAEAARRCPTETVDALHFARDRIETYHRRQLPCDDRFTDPLGVELGPRWTAL